MLIELIGRPGCPNVQGARQNLLKALAAAGRPTRWTEWDGGDPHVPAHARQFASPTILVNGSDVAADQGVDGEACRLYTGPPGSISGVPGVELIAAALTPHAPGKLAARDWRRGLAVAPLAGVAFLPKLACPACWPAYAALVSSLGLGVLMSARFLLGLTVVFLVMALGAIALAGRRSGRHLPLIAGLAATAVILTGKFSLESRAMLYLGAGGLVGASVWSSRPPRQSSAEKCGHCEGIDSKEQNNGE